jgi:predicted transcriptional regulator
VKTVVVYASSPMKKVIGEFEIECILFDELNNLWQNTHQYAGIDKSHFLNYFSDKQQGYAIAIKNTKAYSAPLSLKENFNMLPPQSFSYIS